MSAYVDQHRERFGVVPICETLDVSASAYYHRATGERSERVVCDERLLAVIRDTHEANYFAYGYRRMWKALLRAGETAPRCQVPRLMAEHGIQGAKRRGKPWKTTTTDPEAQRSPDLVRRDFTAERPNQLWVADFTYLRCWEGVLYFSFVIDVFSRMLVGWQLASNMRKTLVLDALRMALGLRAPGADVALVHHSDAGSQYTSIDYTQTLDDHLVLASIGTVGDALDNALAESFVDSYKTELISDRVWRSQPQLELATVKWVAWFNHDRLHSSLGDIPPVEFEHHHAAAIALDPSISLNGSVATISPKPANGLTTRRLATVGVDFVARDQVASSSGLVAPSGGPLRPRQQPVNRPSTACGLSDLRLRNILADRTFQLLTKRRPIPRNSVSAKAGPPHPL